MSATLVFTFIGADKPGLIETLAQTVSNAGGNWLESRMSELAGQFAGIVQVDIAKANQAQLREALTRLHSQGLTVVVADHVTAADDAHYRHLRLSTLGPVRPGIVGGVARGLASRQRNVRAMDTVITSAAMSAEPLFEAVAESRVRKALDVDGVNERLDESADALTVDVDLGESLR